jgi:UDP-glucose 4-epimerase
VVATSEEALDDELDVLERFLSGLAQILARTRTPPNGALFLSSSAGGVYAGSAGALFTESTEPVATSPYGRAKLASERIATDFAAVSGVPTMVGRMSNLYGPGQHLDKPQGLISQLFLSQRTRRPLSIYVPLDTARDYLYVDDAARILLAATDRVAEEPPGATVVKILASQRSVTIASILGELRHLVRRRPLIVLGSSHLSDFQTRHLRFRSEVWRDLDSLVTTPLPAGMSATMAGVARDAG